MEEAHLKEIRGIIDKHINNLPKMYAGLTTSYEPITDSRSMNIFSRAQIPQKKLLPAIREVIARSFGRYSLISICPICKEKVLYHPFIQEIRPKRLLCNGDIV